MVLLLNPPLYYDKYNNPQALDASQPPLGLLYLSSMLNHNNIQNSVDDICLTKHNLLETVGFINSHRVNIIGISCMTPALQGATTLATKIKKLAKHQTTIILGGPHVSSDPDFVNRHSCFDIGITGEAEITFLEIYNKISQGHSLDKIYTGKTPQDLDKLPWPNRQLPFFPLYNSTASLIATRGCPYHCYYCSRPAVDNHVRLRSPNDIVSEMESLYPQCQGKYQFQDDSLTINKPQILQLCYQIKKLSHKYHWAGYTRIDLVDEETIKQMSLAGCTDLTFGIESGDEKIRKEIVGKNFSNKDINTVISLCQKYRVNANGFFILGHPTETIRQVTNTVKFILSHHFSVIGVSIATPFPGSKLWNYAVKENIIDLDFIDKFATGQLGQGYAGIYPPYCPKTLSLNWLYNQRRYIMRHFYLRPGYVISRLWQNLKSPKLILNDICEGLNVLFKGSSARSPYKKILQNEKRHLFFL